MKVFVIFDKKGSMYQPVYLSKKEASQARHEKGMLPANETHVETLIVAGVSVKAFLKRIETFIRKDIYDAK